MSGYQRQRHLCMHSAVKHPYWGVSKPGSQVCTLPWASAVWQKPNFHRSKQRNDAACTIKLNQRFQFEKNWSSPKALQTPTSCNQPSHCMSFSANNAMEREKFVSIPTHSSEFWPWEPWLMSVISAKLCPFPMEQLITKPVFERQGICFKRTFMTTQLSNTTAITMACWGKFETLSSPKQSHNSLSEKLSTAIVFALQTCRQLPSPEVTEPVEPPKTPQVVCTRHAKTCKGTHGRVQFRAVCYQNWFTCSVMIKFTWTSDKVASKMQEQMKSLPSVPFSWVRHKEPKARTFLLCPTFPSWDPLSLSKTHKNKQLNLSLIWTRFSFALNKQISPAVYSTVRQEGDKTKIPIA